jgi:hypothetical protein
LCHVSSAISVLGARRFEVGILSVQVVNRLDGSNDL